MEIVKLRSCKIIGYKVTCPYDRLHIEVPKLWNKLLQFLSLNDIKRDILDVTIEVNKDLFTQMVGIIDYDNLNPSKEMCKEVIEEAYYLKRLHQGKIESIWETYQAMQTYAIDNQLTLDPLDRKIDWVDQNNHQHVLYQRIILNQNME